MTIGFASPWMLAGVLAALLPLWLHLWLRRQAPVVPLEALMRLVLGVSGTALRVRWMHHALLASRVLLLILVAVAFARPYREVPSSGLAGERPLALALVIDDSLSMRWKSRERSDFEEARQRALQALGELPEGSRVFLVRTSRPREVEPRRGPGLEPVQAVFRVERMAATWKAGDLAAALATARRRLRENPLPDRRILALSDFRNADARGGAEEVQDGIHLLRDDVTGGEPGENRAILEVRALPDPEAGSGAFRVQAEVWNGTSRSLDEVLSIRAGGQVTAERVECPPMQRCPVSVGIHLPEDVRFGEVRLPPDALPDDDVAWFVAGAGSRASVLVLEGPASGQGPAFFVGRALGLNVGGWSREVRRVPVGAFSPLQLAGVAAVVAADPGPLSPERVQAIQDYVRAGGTLWLAPGPGTPLEAWNDAWKGLVPGTLRRIRLLDAASGEGQPVIEAGTDFLDESVAARIREVRVRQVALPEAGWPEGWRRLASVGPGLPLWLAGSLGEGRVILWLSSLDPSWNDLPLSPAFVSFLRETLEWAARSSGGSEAEPTRPGEARPLRWPEGEPDLRVTVPSGTVVAVGPPGVFAGTDQPGVYAVHARGDGRSAPRLRDIFVVQPDPRESLFGPGLSADASRGTIRPGTGAPVPRKSRKSLVTPVLLGALLLLMVEAFLRGRT
ncbi:BatA and WFA domain-containing protein [Myxococcota bacterium]|nr:BatA and WFA domain-containing protein [Myxococcota bacterium]